MEHMTQTLKLRGDRVSYDVAVIRQTIHTITSEITVVLKKIVQSRIESKQFHSRSI